MRLRSAGRGDMPFLVEMARLASTLEDRPIPEPDDPGVVAPLPSSLEAAFVAVSEEAAGGAGWWHVHEPPLLRDAEGFPLPELVMAVHPGARRRGLGTALVEAVAAAAAEQFDSLSLNVHLANPAVHLYMGTGFRVAGQGRGWYGVAMVRTLR